MVVTDLVQYQHPSQGILPPEVVSFLKAKNIAPESLPLAWKEAVVEVAQHIQKNPLEADTILANAVKTYNDVVARAESVAVVGGTELQQPNYRAGLVFGS